MSLRRHLHPPVRLPWGLVSLLLSGLITASCGEGEHPLQKVRDGEAEVTGKGVLVIAVDGLRWDHTSLAGYDRDTTPFLARFAKDAMVFSNAWSATPSLVGSHVAILSGCDPSLAQPPDVRATMGATTDFESADDSAWLVPDDLWLLGRPFLGKGWTTAAFVDHPMIAELRGFDRGFREFVEFGRGRDDGDTEIGAFGVGRRFVQWLNRLPLDQDWFAYVHMNDLERVWDRRTGKVQVRGADEGIDGWRPRRKFAYVPPLGLTEPLFHALPPSRANRAQPVTLAQYELRYDRGIRALDASLARLVGTAEDFDRADDITIVIVGSFGTGLGEHGLYLQAGLAEDVDLHVPLLVRPSRKIREGFGWQPGESGAWRTCDALVGLVDVAPTVTDLAGVGVREGVHGVTLRPLLDGSRDSVRMRVMARSSVLPGFAVIEGHTARAAYDPSRAAPSVATSWSSSLDRSESGGGEGDPTLRALWRHWEALLEQERRALHFGVGSSDRAHAKEIRALQGLDQPNDGTQKEETTPAGPGRSEDG